MDVNFWGTVYCTKYALPYSAGFARVAGRHLVGGRFATAGAYGLFGFEICDDGILETVRIENLKKGCT